MIQPEQYYEKCIVCPRNCGVDRREQPGICGCKATLKAARAGLHYYEEPFLAGTRGSGTVFFTGCSLGCVYCQNGQISQDGFGIEISIPRLTEIFLEQQGRGAHNLNLVTGTHYTPSIAEALKEAKSQGLSIPVVWNSSGYEKKESLQLLNGLVDIFLPDLKTLSPQLGMRYMKAPDYPERAKEALECMVQMIGKTEFTPLESACPAEEQELFEGENVLMTRGVVVRHLVIPGQIEDSKAVLKYLHETYGDRIWISLMSQYTPVGAFAMNRAASGNVAACERRHTNEGDADSKAMCKEYPELCRTLSLREYNEVVDYAIDLGIEQCMIQEDDVASESFIPLFDGTGINCSDDGI